MTRSPTGAHGEASVRSDQSKEASHAINVGTVDRILRALLGVLLLYLAFGSGLALFEGGVVKYLAAGVGIVMLVVAAVRICPVYTLIGIRTCRAA